MNFQKRMVVGLFVAGFIGGALDDGVLLEGVIAGTFFVLLSIGALWIVDGV